MIEKLSNSEAYSVSDLGEIALLQMNKINELVDAMNDLIIIARGDHKMIAKIAEMHNYFDILDISKAEERLKYDD